MLTGSAGCAVVVRPLTVPFPCSYFTPRAGTADEDPYELATPDSYFTPRAGAEGGYLQADAGSSAGHYALATAPALHLESPYQLAGAGEAGDNPYEIAETPEMLGRLVGGDFDA